MFKEKFQARIKELFEEDYDLNTPKMAKEADISTASLNFYLHGKRCPDAQALYKMCTAYGVSADWLMGLTDDPARGTLRIFLRNGSVHRIRNNYRGNARIEVIEYDQDGDDSLMYEKLFNDPAYKEYDGEVEYIRCEGIADLADRMEDEAGYVQITSGEGEYKFKKKEGDALIQFSTLQGIRDFLDIMNRPACSNTESAR